MLFRLPNGSLLELNKNDFISDKDYYSNNGNTKFICKRRDKIM